jgi:hypothetical protein
MLYCIIAASLAGCVIWHMAQCYALVPCRPAAGGSPFTWLQLWGGALPLIIILLSIEQIPSMPLNVLRQALPLTPLYVFLPGHAVSTLRTILALLLCPF